MISIWQILVILLLREVFVSRSLVACFILAFSIDTALAREVSRTARAGRASATIFASTPLRRNGKYVTNLVKRLLWAETGSAIAFHAPRTPALSGETHVGW